MANLNNWDANADRVLTQGVEKFCDLDEVVELYSNKSKVYTQAVINCAFWLNLPKKHFLSKSGPGSPNRGSGPLTKEKLF